MTTPKFSATVQNGVIQMQAQVAFAAYLKRFEGTQVVVTIEKPKAKRSLNANAFYWAAIVTPLCEEFGHRLPNNDDIAEITTHEVHEYLAEKFLPVKYVTLNGGDQLRVRTSTAKLSRADFTNYINNIQEWAMDQFGIILPDAEARLAA